MTKFSAQQTRDGKFTGIIISQLEDVEEFREMLFDPYLGGRRNQYPHL